LIPPTAIISKMTREKDIAFTHDLDGVHFIFAPPPVKTTLSLIRRDLKLPLQEVEPEPFVAQDSLLTRLENKIKNALHSCRPLHPDSLQTIDLLNLIGSHYHRQLDHFVLSGREPLLHSLTERRLCQTGLKAKIPESRLNKSVSASAWKEWQVRNLKNEGYRTTIHVDDDLRPVLRIARLEGHTLCYLLRNPSNSPLLLRRNGLSLPENVVSVANFSDMLFDFENRLSSGRI
jgi:hypothetical protein